MACSTFWQARLDKVNSQIVLYEDAIDAIVVGGASSYTLDTGQSRQTVTKQDLSSLQSQLNRLFARRDSILARCGDGGTIARPGW